MNFQRKIVQGETSKEDFIQDYCLVLKPIAPLKILKVLYYILFIVLFIIENYESMQTTWRINFKKCIFALCNNK